MWGSGVGTKRKVGAKRDSALTPLTAEWPANGLVALPPPGLGLCLGASHCGLDPRPGAPSLDGVGERM